MQTYSDAIDFLRAHHLAVVSTVSKSGAPQCATVFFHIGDVESASRFHIYFVTRRHTRKFANLTANPSVAMVLGTDLEPHSVQIEGSVELIETGDAIQQLTDMGNRLLTDPQLGMLYVGAFFPQNPFGKIEGSDFAVFRVTPTWIRYMHPDASGKHIEYTQLLS